MKRILIIVLAMMMLISCVACSNNNNTTDPTDGTKPSVNDNTNPTNPGQTDNTSPTNPSTKPSDLPIEQRPPIDDVGGDNVNKQQFPDNDPRKQYLEDKYGVTAYLVAEKTAASLHTVVALEGYDATFHLYAKEDLVATGASADSIATDYVDDGYFVVAYADVYQYFTQAAKAAGVTVNRIIVEYKGSRTFMYDHNKAFTEMLASAPDNAKRFNLVIYGDFDDDNNAIGKLLMALDELDFAGQVEFRHVLQDISNVTNTELLHDAASVYSQFSERQRIK